MNITYKIYYFQQQNAKDGMQMDQIITKLYPSLYVAFFMALPVHNSSEKKIVVIKEILGYVQNEYQ